MSLVALELKAEERRIKLEWTKAVQKWAIEMAPVGTQMLQRNAPVGKTGNMRKSIHAQRFTYAGDVGFRYVVDANPGLFVLKGTKPHNIPNAFGYGPNFGTSGRFEGFFHPGNKPNDFVKPVWEEFSPIAHEALNRYVAKAITSVTFIKEAK